MANSIKSLAIAVALAFPAEGLAQSASVSGNLTASQDYHITAQITCQSRNSNAGSVVNYSNGSSVSGDISNNDECSSSQDVVVIVTEKKAVECNNNTSVIATSCEQLQQTWTIKIEQDSQAAHDNQGNGKSGPAPAQVEGQSTAGDNPTITPSVVNGAGNIPHVPSVVYAIPDANSKPSVVYPIGGGEVRVTPTNKFINATRPWVTIVPTVKYGEASPNS